MLAARAARSVSDAAESQRQCESLNHISCMITANLRATAAVALRWQPRVLSFGPRIFTLPKPKKVPTSFGCRKRRGSSRCAGSAFTAGRSLERRNEDPTAYACA